MSSDKPSKNEDEYFARKDLELLKSRRQKRQEDALEAERRSHYMKCPKDGHDITTESFHDVQIERCPHCNGIWLDAGELEDLMAKEDTGLIGRVFRDISISLKGSKGSE
ncbi:MAG: zf-TFIIB domain-containing protein [Gemmatimonadales bacterium]|nr:zf-TFIIB domain-containing protein [Gemmatimonadales bacterium]